MLFILVLLSGTIETFRTLGTMRDASNAGGFKREASNAEGFKREASN